MKMPKGRRIEVIDSTYRVIRGHRSQIVPTD